MTLILDVQTDRSCDLADVVDYLASGAFDPESRDSLVAAAPMLAALSNNRKFLADHAIAALKNCCAEQSQINSYSPQVLLLSPPSGKFVLRANIWPSRDDAILRESSPDAWFYHFPHDHAFDFLTVGYAGPGYWSDYYEYDGVVDGVPGEAVHLKPVGRKRLEPGQIKLYRANQDIHDQLPPDALSVSVNILPLGERQYQRRQYLFDLAEQRIKSCITMSGGEVLLALSVRFGGSNGRDLAEHMLDRHIDPRMRLAAWKAIDAAANTMSEREDAWARGLSSDCALIRTYAQKHGVSGAF